MDDRNSGDMQDTKIRSVVTTGEVHSSALMPHTQCWSHNFGSQLCGGAECV